MFSTSGVSGSPGLLVERAVHGFRQLFLCCCTHNYS